MRQPGLVVGPSISIGMLMSPEIIAELSRIQGAAVGFTGFDAKMGHPEFLAVVLPGQSNAPGLFMRTMLTMAPVNRLETIEGVTLYSLPLFTRKEKMMPRGKALDAPPVRKLAAAEEAMQMEPAIVLAMTPGALFAGSEANVKEAVLRFKGKLMTASLAKSAVFQEARKEMGNQPGLQVFVVPQPIVQLVEKFVPIAGQERAMMELALKTFNPRIFRALAKSVSLEDGTLTARNIGLLDPNEKIAVLNLYPTRPLDQRIFHFAPKDSVFAAAMDNGDGGKRFLDFVAIVDTFMPKEFKFSDAVKGIEGGLGVSLSKDVFAQIGSVGYALGDPLKSKIKIVEEVGPNFTRTSSTSEPPPMVFLLQATDDKAADNLIRLVPKMFAAAGNSVDPITRKVDGQDILVLKLGREEEFCYGRHDATIVIGPYAAGVAASLNGGAKKQGLLAVPQVAGRLKDLKDRQAILLMKPAHLIAGMGMGMASGSSHGTGIGAAEKPKGDKEPVKPQKPEKKITYKSPMDEPFMKGLSEIFSKEEYLVASKLMTRDKMIVEGQVPGLRTLVSRLVDFGVEAMMQQEVRHQEFMEKMRKQREKGFDK